jgi:hypothetical protein
VTFLPFINLDRVAGEVELFGRDRFYTSEFREFLRQRHPRVSYFIHDDNYQHGSASDGGVQGALRALRRVGFLDYDPRKGYWVCSVGKEAE